MKQQIAGFLGELAEELGWTPELEDARVKPERSEPARPRQPGVLPPDPPQDPNSLTTPVDRMRSELTQLRSTVKHLGAEVIQLRAQMAQLRHLPVPPDAMDMKPSAGDINAALPPPRNDVPWAEVATQVSSSEAVEPEARPWPPRVASTPAAAPSVSERESSDSLESTGGIGDGGAQHSEPAPPLAERVPEPAPAVIDRPAKAVARDDAPTVVAVDEPDSALELFPAEPGVNEDHPTDGETEISPPKRGAAGSTGYMKSLYRRMGGDAR